MLAGESVKSSTNKDETQISPAVEKAVTVSTDYMEKWKHWDSRDSTTHLIARVCK